MARESMSQIKQHEEKIADDTSNKRKWKGDHKGSSSQQQNKEPKVIRAHTARPSNKESYVRNLPLCNKCMFHHTSPCAAKCGNCKRFGHQTRYCRTLVLRAKQSPSVAKQKAEVTCYECGMLGHYKSRCQMWKFQKHMNEYGKKKLSETQASVRTSPLTYDPEVERSARLRRKVVRQFSTNLDFAGLKELFMEMSDDDATGAESPARAIVFVFRGHEEPYAHLREFFSIADTYQVNNTTKDGELVKVFYDGLDYHNQQSVMATSGGTFFSRPMEEEWEFFEKLSKGSKTQAWVDRNNNHTSSANFVSNRHGTNSEISELSKKVDLLLRNIGKGVPNVSQVSHNACLMCGDLSHSVNNCQSRGAPLNEEVNGVYGNRPRNDPFFKSYNPGWRNHPNFRWKDDDNYNHPNNTQQQNHGYIPSGLRFGRLAIMAPVKSPLTLIFLLSFDLDFAELARMALELSIFGHLALFA
uniref:CCHC-type domain-containing protein n=1 Tax=Tanacetum cinerariifolium TaxID=118510 RepID=A0A6L2LJ89_TANCI|nr:hypothetical protein [Tanacetum cinerariifolium]